MDQLIRKINRQFARLRESNQREMKRRKIEIYRKLPRIKAIDHEMMFHSRDIISFIADSPEDLAGGVSEIARVSAKLNTEKEKILVEEGYPADYLKPIYHCQTCKDRGYLESGERCVCFQIALTRAAYQSSALEQKLIKENFQHFNIELFSDKPDELRAISPRENMQNIYDSLNKFIADFEKINGDNFLFYGMTGRGKTFMLTAVAKDLIDAGKSVSYQTAYELFRTAELNTFTKELNDEQKMRYDMIFNADLLLIDDLGTEMVNNFTQMELFNIVNIRLLRDKKTIISSNLNPKELSEIYGERLASRFIGHYQFLEFFGEDIRQKI